MYISPAPAHNCVIFVDDKNGKGALPFFRFKLFTTLCKLNGAISIWEDDGKTFRYGYVWSSEKNTALKYDDFDAWDEMSTLHLVAKARHHLAR